MYNFSANTPFDPSKAFAGFNFTPNIYSTSSNFTPSYLQKPPTTPTQDHLEQAEQIAALEEKLTPTVLARAKAFSDLQAELSAKQLAQVYPYLTAARSRATSEDLAASQAYRRFAEQLPSNVQNIMASKQAQMQSAQAGEAALQQATADQLRAAKESQGRFAGQYIQFG